MRTAVYVAAGLAALTVSLAPAFAAPNTGMTVDTYSFAGGREAMVLAPLQPQTGRSAAAPRAFTKDDVAHAFAWGFVD